MLSRILLSRWCGYILMIVAISLDVCVKLYDSAVAMGSNDMLWCRDMRSEMILAEWLCFGGALGGVHFQKKTVERKKTNFIILSVLVVIFLVLKVIFV